MGLPREGQAWERGDIREALEGRKHCRRKNIQEKLRPMLVGMAVAMEPTGKLQKEKQ